MISPRTVFSLTKWDLICIHKEIVVALFKVHQSKALCQQEKLLLLAYWVGVIYKAEVIDTSLKEPQAVVTSKKGKVDGKVVNVLNGRIGTRTEHYLTYLSNVMDKTT